MASLSHQKPRSKFQFLAALTLGSVAWLVAIGFATVGYSQQLAWGRTDIVQQEVLYYAYAFATAGTITGVMAADAPGRRRWAITLFAVNVILLAASVPIVRWLIFLATAPNVGWGQSVWNSALGCIGFGLASGAVAGLIGAGPIVGLLILERRWKPWQFGLMVAAISALLGIWALPALLPSLSDLVIFRVGVHYRYLYDEAMRGSATGAGMGTLVGAIIAGLLARWYGSAAGSDRRG